MSEELKCEFGGAFKIVKIISLKYVSLCICPIYLSHISEKIQKTAKIWAA